QWKIGQDQHLACGGNGVDGCIAGHRGGSKALRKLLSLVGGSMSAKKPTFGHRNKLRKKRIAIILGNLIIIGTFIARDVLRESLKERLNNLNIAQVSYVSRYDVSTILMQTVDFTSGINRFMHRIERHATGTEASEEDKLNYEFEIMNA